MPGPRRQRARCRRVRRSPRWRRRRPRNSARHRRRCARPRPACRRNSGTRGARRRAPAPRSMVWPSTKCEPSSRIAWRVAARTAGRPSRLTSASTMPSGVSPGWMTRAVMPERPGRGRHQKRARMRLVMRPVAGRELVLDQAVGGGGVGHAQQRLGQHHQREALLGRERIGVQEILDAAEAARARRGSLSTSRVARASMRASAAGGRAALASNPAAIASSAGA